MLLQKSCPLVVSVWRHLQQPPALLFSIIWIIIHDLIKKVGGKWGFKILNCRFWMRTWTKICTTTPVPTPNFQKILQRLIKSFMDLNLEIAYSISKMERYMYLHVSLKDSFSEIKGKLFWKQILKHSWCRNKMKSCLNKLEFWWWCKNIGAVYCNTPH